MERPEIENEINYNNYAIQNGETIKQYEKRISSYHGMFANGWYDVAKIINYWTDRDFSESKYRKTYQNWQYFSSVDSEVDGLKIKEEMYKLNQENRDIWNTIRRYWRVDARDNAWRKTALECAQKSLPLKIKLYKSEYTPIKDRFGVALISDWHVGSQPVNIVRERMAKYAEEVIRYCQTFKLSKLYLLNLGDLIEGNIHLTGRIENELKIHEQVFAATDILTELLLTIDNNLPKTEIEYHSVLDNHSRIIANYKESLEVESFACFIDWMLIERITKSKGTHIVFKDSNYDETLDYITLPNNKIFGFEHGHLEKTTVKEGNKRVFDLDGAQRMLGVLIDYFALAHFHSFSVANKNGAKIIVNGTSKGQDTYSKSKRFNTQVSQTLIAFIDAAEIFIDFQLDN